MPIHPLPQFEEDLSAHEADLAAHAAMKPPTSVVVRFGAMKMVGEFPYDGDVRPGCGSRMVVRTHRGTELGEMLTSTCPNAGCSKSVTRKEMLEYIENSGGRKYPFSNRGRVLRIATTDDMERQAALEQSRHGLKMEARRVASERGVPLKIVDAEPILGGETLTFYVLAEERVDIREINQVLREHFRASVDIRQVGARDEARLTADYERCGQYCCCKNFLKVLKPVSMRSAKTQKATLEPLKISGRCGRLMCCLRYEDETYEDLRRRLPKRKTRVGTPDGDGTVLDTQILTQLVLVQLDHRPEPAAYAVEDLGEAGSPARAEPMPPREPSRDRPRDGDRARPGGPPRGAEASGSPEPRSDGASDAGSSDGGERREGEQPREGERRRRRRRRRRRQGRREGDGPAPPPEPAP